MKLEIVVKKSDKTISVSLNDLKIKNPQILIIENKKGKFIQTQVQQSIDNSNIETIEKNMLKFQSVEDYVGKAIIYLDPNRAIIIPDKWGRIPLFCYFSKNKTIISSSFNSITKLTTLKIDKNNLLEFLYFGYSFRGKLLFKNTFIIPPTAIIIANNSIYLKKIKSPLKDIIDNNNPNLKKIDKEITTCFSKYYSENDSYLISLSGGLDSRLLLKKFIELKKKKPTALTYGTKNDRDMILAKRVCQYFGINQKKLIIESNDFKKNSEEFVDFCGGSTSITNSRAFNKFKEIGTNKTIINGFVGDLTFGGGFHKRPLIEMKSMPALIHNLSKRLCKIGQDDFSLLFRINKNSLKKQIIIILKEEIREVGSQGSLALVADKILMNTKVIFDTYWTVLFSAQKAKVISPMYDPKLNLFFLSIDAKKRYKHKLYSKFMTKKYPSLSRITWQKTGTNLFGNEDKTISKNNINRRIPYQLFYNGPLKKWVNAMLLSKRSKIIKFVSKKALNNILSRKELDNNWADFVGSAITVEILMRKYL